MTFSKLSKEVPRRLGNSVDVNDAHKDNNKQLKILPTFGSKVRRVAVRILKMRSPLIIL